MSTPSTFCWTTASRPAWTSAARRARRKSLEDRIVIQTLEAEQTTASGLVIPDTAKEKPQEGKVLAVGPGRVDDSGKLGFKG